MGNEAGSAAWGMMLEDWKTLPADSDVWDNLDQFVGELRSLAANKLEEREAGRRKLTAAIEKLLGAFKEDLGFFDLENSASWSADHVARQDAESVASLVDSLGAELQSRRNLESQHAAHYAEEKQRRATLSELEDKIAAQLATLQLRFAQDAAPSHPTPAPSAPAQPEPAAPQETRATTEVATAAPEAEPAESEADSESWLHAALDAAGKRYSPLTTEQEQIISGDSSGVCLVIASGALDFEVIPKAIQRLCSQDSTIVTSMPFEIDGEDATVTWLERFAASSAQASRLIIHRTLATPTPTMNESVEAAIRFCRGFTKSQPNRSVRVCYLLAPVAAWSWLTQPENKRRDLEGQIDARISPTPWTAQAVCKRMQQLNLPASGDGCLTVVEETGGFPWLLDKLFDSVAPIAGVDGAVEQLRLLLVPGGPLAGELPARLGLMAAPPARDVVQLFREKGEFTEQQLTEEAVARGIDAKQCRSVIDLMECIACVTRDSGVVKLNPFVRRLLMPS